MKRKILSLMVALLLMITTFVPFSKAIAQGLVEYAIILVVVGVGEDETAEIYWRPTPSPPGHTQADRVFFNYNYFFNVTSAGPTASPSDEACTEAVQTTVNGRSGLNVLTLEMGEGNDSLLVNGEEVPLTESCLEEAKRIVFEVGIQHPRSAQTHATLVVYNIVGHDGETRASGLGGLKSGTYYIKEVAHEID